MTQNEQPLNLKALAAMLGYSRSTLVEWRRAGMPYHIVGTSKVYFPSEVLEWLRKRPGR